jgi:hypothetical protein
LVAVFVTLFHVALFVERCRVMVRLPMPVVPALSVPLMVKLWLTDAVDGALMVSVVGVLTYSVPMA